MNNRPEGVRTIYMNVCRSAIWYIGSMKRWGIEQHVGGFFTEFWKFAAKGNAIQLAVAVVLGGAFGAIVNSLVADIITPLISILTNNVNFSTWAYVVRPEQIVSGKTEAALVIGYGKLLQASLNFLIVGLSIFGLFKAFQGVLRRFQSKEAEEPVVAVSTEEKLLSEIRDLLKESLGKRNDSVQ